jgi:hypothetical protein
MCVCACGQQRASIGVHIELWCSFAFFNLFPIHIAVSYQVGQNQTYVGLARTVTAPYMTVYLVNSLPKLPYIHRIYMVLANLKPSRAPK